MSAWRVFACLPLVSLLGLTGCVVHPLTQLYQLDVDVVTMPKRDGGAAVLLDPAQLTGHPKRDVTVQRQAGDILSLSVDTRWADNLETNVNRQLLRQISGELGSSRLTLFPKKSGFTPQVQVVPTISRPDSGPKQPMVIEARWCLLDQKGDLKDSRVFHKEEWHQGSVGDRTRAQSDLLKRPAAQLAGDVKPIAAVAEAPPPATARKLVTKSKAREEEDSKMPLVVPIRTDVEVYRF